MVDDGFQAARTRMVERQLRARGIASEPVLKAMGRVPRHLFVAAAHRDEAYADHPLPIGCGQTISQPYMVARMTELCALRAGDRVLEVGAGCGYQTCVLAALCAHVHAVEIVPELAELARANLAEAGCDNVSVACRDGSLGWPEQRPFDAIVVAAAAPRVPGPLRRQLAPGGRLVVPVGGRGLQILQRVTRREDDWDTLQDTACRFVSLLGEHGWHD